MAKKTPTTYEAVALGALHGEFSFSNKSDTDAEINRLLKRNKLGDFDAARIDLLRRFKDEMQREIGLRPLPEPARFTESPYYVGRHGKYGDYTDFDIPRLTADMMARYPGIPKDDVEWFVRYAVGTYYLL